MKCYVGIDLGSTTTKAIVLDERGDVLGRGITNSRSNYDVACEVARDEAFVDARMELFRRELQRAPGPVDDVATFLEALRQGFRHEQHLRLLAELEGVCRDQGGRSSLGARAGAALDEIFGELRQEAHELFGPGSRPRSDFFRDIAGGRYMSLAETVAPRHGLEFEALLGLYDKSIITVENHVPDLVLRELLEQAVARALGGEGRASALAGTVERSLAVELEEAATVGTGYGRARLPFAREFIRSEILCHGLGAHATFPETRTVLDIGGQDTKAIQVDGRGVVQSFQMNDRCAAGCGRYLGYIADEMNIGLHQLGPLAMKATRTVRINSTCTVFAGAEFRDRLAMGQSREDILAGLHRAIMLRAMSLIARSGGVHDEFTFTGGVARNEAAVKALMELVRENYGERKLNISPDSIYTGALGAALFALRSGQGEEAPPDPLEAAKKAKPVKKAQKSNEPKASKRGAR